MSTQTTASVARGAKLRTKKPTRASKKPVGSLMTRKAMPAARREKQPDEPALSKQDKLTALLRRPDGATIAELTDATGWQAHSVRGAMSGALKKKLKLTIDSAKVEGRGRVYRIG